MCETQRLEQFRVCFDLNKFSQHELDDWLAFAFARDVQRLELDLLKGGLYIRDFDYCYTFPERLIGLSDSATSSNDFHILPLVWQNFKSLKVLHLKSVNVTGVVLEFFLHNCPFLEQMVVRGSGTLVNLEVVGPSLKLKHLEIWYCHKVKSLKICDTNLVSLVTSAGMKLLLKNVPKLIEVEIRGIPYPHIFKDISSVLSCVLFQLEVLKIHSVFSSENLEHYDFPELTKLRKFVVVSLEQEDPNLLSYTGVMRAAPQLKEVELQLKWLLPSREKWTERECRKARSCPLHHLRVVKLCGYFGCTSEVELISFFLENAMALRKIIIDPRCPVFPSLPRQPIEIEREQTARNLAKLQLQGLVNSDIEFVIL